MLEILIAAAFLLILFALAVAFRVTVKDVELLVNALRRPPSFRELVSPKKRRLRKFVCRTLFMMEQTGQAGKFYFLVTLSFGLSAVGIAAGIGSGNVFLSPVLGFGLAAAPFLYIRLQYMRYNRLLISELEVTLSTISMSYERTENILSAIEENLEPMQAPIKDIFAGFVNTVRYINPNMAAAIDDMKTKIDHSVWNEWCDALGRCVTDRGLKYTLRPIVGELTKIKTVSGELQTMLYKAVRNFWTLLALTAILLIVCMKLVPDGMGIEIPRLTGNIVVAVNVLFIVIAGIKVIFESHDVKFDI